MSKSPWKRKSPSAGGPRQTRTLDDYFSKSPRPPQRREQPNPEMIDLQSGLPLTQDKVKVNLAIMMTDPEEKRAKTKDENVRKLKQVDVDLPSFKIKVLVSDTNPVSPAVVPMTWKPSPRKPEPLGTLNKNGTPSKSPCASKNLSPSQSASDKFRTSLLVDSVKVKTSNTHLNNEKKRKSSSPQPSSSKQPRSELSSPSTVVSSRSASPNLLSEDEYEVEAILDYVKLGSDHSYLIKWKGWSEEHNTWEPPENLNCEEEMWAFYLKRKAERNLAREESGKDEQDGRKRRKVTVAVPPDPRPLKDQLYEFFSQTASPTEEEIQSTLKKMKRTKSRWDQCKVARNLELWRDKVLTEEQKEHLRDQLLFLHVDNLKEESTNSLRKWEIELNKITKGRPNISVENGVDFSGPPADFVYTNDYVASDGIIIPDDPPVGCSCPESCQEKRDQKNCCPSSAGAVFAYTSKKKLRLETGNPIYECNKKCECGPECPNRVVQDGVNALRGMEMAIYRTSNGCGWGVKTARSIKKGTFVCLYVGEIINTEEAERRGQEYDAEGCTYLFDLDINEDQNNECPYTIDAAKFGNVSHFMNHSCEPNLHVFSVWVNCLDPNLPKLALFAKRDIMKGEELTFDYKSNRNSNLSDESDDNPPKDGPVSLIKQTPCLCGAKECRKLLF